MSAVFNRSLRIKSILEALSVECFVPMRNDVHLVGRRKICKTVPAVRNLIFIRSTSGLIKTLKSHYPFIQYLTCKSDGHVKPIVVPDEQMRHFIAVAGTNEDRLIYLAPAEIRFDAGDKVRIRGGVFDGVEGVFLKVKGARDKRVVVSIEGVAAVATTAIHPDLLEKI